MEKWGLGPADLPHSLVYTRISGYGQMMGPMGRRGPRRSCRDMPACARRLAGSGAAQRGMAWRALACHEGEHQHKQR